MGPIEENDLSKSAAQSKSREIRILVAHGPNLNLLGKREPEVYGSQTLAEIDSELAVAAKAIGSEAGLQVDVDCFQSNHEGELIDRIQEAMDHDSGILINPGGFTHTSVALRDALVATRLPIVEVHLSNVYAREPFRQISYVSPIALGVISGLGARGYRYGLEALVDHLKSQA
jgi:3-dehydroquinate dehydratase-2